MSAKSFCFFKYPGESDIFLVVGELCEWKRQNEEQTEGFVLSPFLSSEKSWIILGKPIKLNATGFNLSGFYLNDVSATSQDEATYTALVQEAVGTIKSNLLNKVIAARSLCVDNPEDFNVYTFFIKLSNQFPNAFVYLFSSPETGTWMGATPEMLLNQIGLSGRTVALAGTRTQMNFTAFNDKEILEQQWVLRFIKETLIGEHCTITSSNELKEKKAGNLVHLLSEVAFEFKENQDRWSVLNKLHPTPAVAGYPQKEAIQFINSHETFDRTFYSGFLGYLSSDEMRLFVNIRCMQVGKLQSVLYAGAGITIDSDPKAEWLETENKLQTLLMHLR